jgi:hypothetical protein
MRKFDAASKAKYETGKSQSAVTNQHHLRRTPFFTSPKSSENAFFGLNTVQPKLETSHSNDEYEKEADAVADNVMMQPDLEKPVITMQTKLPFQRQTLDEEEEMLHMKPQASFSSGVLQSSSADLDGRIKSAKDGGKRLAPGIKAEMGNRIGADFSKVRIHTGPKSVQISRELGAKAFTVGTDIHFNHGQYAPYNSKGRHLLAHELAHVLQQGGSGLT